MSAITTEVAIARTLGRWYLRPRRRRVASRDRRKTSKWGWRTNIVGVGISRKYTLGRQTRLPSVTFFVKRKLAEGRLLRSERIPPALSLDVHSGKRVMTDVVEVGDAMTLQSGVVDPLRPGASLGHWRGVHGTLGIMVRKPPSPDLFLLSCSHVLALSGEAHEQDPIEQPLIFDEDPDRVVARLTKHFSVLTSTGTNVEDVALAKVEPGIATIAQPLECPQTPTQVSPLLAAGFVPGTVTRLLGAETPGALGRIKAGQSDWWLNGLSFSGLVPYQTSCHNGDSGAAVVSEDGSTLLGLHVAGSSAKRFGVFFPASPIFAKFGLILAT